jgi:hypothetical protein
MRGGRTSRRALKPAQGLERGRDGREVKVMTSTRTGPIVEEYDISVGHLYKWTLRGVSRQEIRYSIELSQGEGESPVHQ